MITRTIHAFSWFLAFLVILVIFAASSTGHFCNCSDVEEACANSEQVAAYDGDSDDDHYIIFLKWLLLVLTSIVSVVSLST